MPEHDSADFRLALEAAKLEALAEFAAGAGHEINNPLATILGRIQLLLPGETDPERRQALFTIGGQTLRIRDMIGDLMLFARPPGMHPQSLELKQVVRQTLAQSGLLREIEAVGMRLDLPIIDDSPVAVWADPVQLPVVISNLVRNSLEALAAGGQITVQCDTVSVPTCTPPTPVNQPDSTAFAKLTVTDNGPSLSELDREHLFDPFYSGRQAGRGLGFGLCKCWRIVTLHGGRIDVTSVPGEQTTFTVMWPCRSATL
ncbi:MAG: HAMP domain-containing histidine kinase [Planctomycetales bacterium]|nr:HAMP domain-containing histidine kinase [Planctomycetales bacterium]